MTRRLIAALVVLSTSVTPLVGGAHAAAQRHHYCVEHGVFEEGARLAPASRDGIDRAPDATHAGHEACAFLTCVSPARGTSLTNLVAPIRVVVRAPLAPVLTDGARQIALLANAPKSSPPLVSLI